MTELVFLVEETPEGGYTARALGPSIFTQADTWAELEASVRKATLCHFDEDPPKVLRLHFVRDAKPARKAHVAAAVDRANTRYAKALKKLSE